MTASTLTTAREHAGDDEQFLRCALSGNYGPLARDAAAEVTTTAEAFALEADPASDADQLIDTVAEWVADGDNEEATA